MLSRSVILGAGFFAALALAVEGSPMLHEYVAPPTGALRPQVLGTGDGRNPRAVWQDSEVLAEPTASAEDEPVFGSPWGAREESYVAEREDLAEMDRNTNPDERLHYAEVFNPSIVPFMRMSALDAILDEAGRDVLSVHDPGLTPIPVGGESSADRDLFWASLKAEVLEDTDVAIPSVAPDMRILSYETEPPLPVTFLKDGADNYFIRAPTNGTFRLVFLADAPASYFAADVPSGYKVGDDAAAGHVHALPSRLQREVIALLPRMGLPREGLGSLPLDRVVSALVGYFRAFEAGFLPPFNGSLLGDIVNAKRGTCRHRSFAFVLTANALGIPARYVTNEAHAFAEIWVPERQWIRIDLGGAALLLDVEGMTDKSIYRPRGEDPFPRPESFIESYTQLAGSIQGLSAEQLGGARNRVAEAPPTTVRLADLMMSASLGQQPTSIFVDPIGSYLEPSPLFRGETVTMSGHAAVSGGVGGGLHVELYLVPASGRTVRKLYASPYARLVGQTVTDDAGDFSVELSLPRDLSLGEHALFARTPGDRQRAPALSD